MSAITYSFEAVSAWIEFRMSPAGKHQRVTPPYYKAWVDTYEAERAAGVPPDKARLSAMQTAANVRALAEGRAAGVRMFVRPKGKDE